MPEDGKILIADDDADIREVVRLLLRAEGYAVTEAENGRAAVEMADDSYDLIILDVMMPELDGFHACERLRQKTLCPILFLTAKTEDSDKTLGFSAGGDDYLVKPFSFSELTARVKALRRRYREYSPEAQSRNPQIRLSDITIDTDTCEVRRGQSVLSLTGREYEIMLLLARNRKKVFSIENIYESVWEEPYFYTCANTVMAHIKNLRRKLTRGGLDADLIHTVWGKGYRIE